MAIISKSAKPPLLHQPRLGTNDDRAAYGAQRCGIIDGELTPVGELHRFRYSPLQRNVAAPVEAEKFAHADDLIAFPIVDRAGRQVNDRLFCEPSLPDVTDLQPITEFS